MLKIKFRQYGVFKKHLNSSLNSLTKFFYNNDTGRIQDNSASNKISEKKPNMNNTNTTNQSKFTDPKILIMKNRRTQNFLKEDEESFKKKQQFFEKEKLEKSEYEEDMESEQDSFLDVNNTNKYRKNNTDFDKEKTYRKTADEKTKDLKINEKKVITIKKEADSKLEVEKNFKSN